MLVQSIDYLKKRLYYTNFRQKKTNKSIYVFSYFPTISAEHYHEWGRKTLFHKAELIAMPSSFKVIKTYQLQGPRINVVIGFVITLKFLSNFFNLSGITCFINNKWYGFFLFLELNKYNFLRNLCDDTQIISGLKPLIVFTFKTNK